MNTYHLIYNTASVASSYLLTFQFDEGLCSEGYLKENLAECSGKGENQKFTT